MKLKVGFTGTREGMTNSQKVSFLSRWLHLKSMSSETIEFHQGQCIGADHDALALVKSQGGVWTVSHPPTNQTKTHDEACDECDEIWPAKDYLTRNHDIVNAVDTMIVVPRTRDEERRSGTWATYRYAQKVGKEIILILPHGGERDQIS